MTRPLLSIEGLDVSFIMDSRSIKAVEGLGLQMGDEEFLGIVGESGCGKTLTALSIMRLLPSNAQATGRILFKGEDILGKSERELQGIRGRDISMIFQEPMTSLNPVFTIGSQIAEVLMVHEGLSKREAMDRAIELLRVVQIPSPELRIREYPHQMSGGMRQRAMIAMAIACNPSLLIADEPTTALDVTIQAQILDLLNRLKEDNQMSILFITHDLGIVAEYAERVVVMYTGRIIEEAGVKEIFLNPRHPYTRGLLESLPRRRGERLIPISGQVPRMDELPPGCKFSTRCRYVKEECHTKEPELLPVDTPDHRCRCIRAGEI
jgi:oligopeptide/dipeptide ABC transporter ATP-binding protein